jgi:DeoR/GlpR family transcriptional regulator of sugar metabolism
MPHGIKAWSLLSRHGQAIVILARNPKLRIADLAKMLSVSERSVRLLLNSLHRSKILRVEKQGRSNRYEIDYSYVLPHRMERSISLKAIVDLADVPLIPVPSPVKSPSH